ncbi:MAG: hypothetical protein ACJ8E5_15430, partial [Xanthobacteraceae bacterium]
PSVHPGVAHMMPPPTLVHSHPHHHHAFGFGVFVAAPVFFGPPYPYPYYPYYPGYYPEGYAPPPAQYIEQPAEFWYYCPGARGYYPYIRECPGGWQPVAPGPPAG